tara:strand:- start:1636 stop:2103 length:468 start_codon:yes stop_codon:yes gene_type:complete
MAFNFPDGASSGDTHTASNGTVYRYNGTTWLVDSANTTSTFDTRYLNTNGDGIISGSQQITGLGFISESSINTSLNAFTASNANTSLNAATSSYLTSSGSVDYTDVTSVPSNIVSGSSQLDGYVSSSSANVIEVMTSASYALITPVSGTLYIIQG